MGFGFLRKLNYLLKVLLGLMVLCELGSTQPFLNSLAVLFRARPPWPTTFPVGSSPNGNTVTSKFNGFPNTNSISQPGMLASGATQQGILVAHPIPNLKPASNSFKKFIPSQLPNFPIHLRSPGQFFPGNAQNNNGQAPKLQAQPVLQNLQPKPVLQNLQPQPVLQNSQPKPVLQTLHQHSPDLQQNHPQNLNHAQTYSNDMHHMHSNDIAQQLVTSSSVSSGSFSYPDPPSPPQFQSMSGQTVDVAPNYATASSNIKPHWQPSNSANNLENHSSGSSKPLWKASSSSNANSLENHSSGTHIRASLTQSSHEQHANAASTSHYSKSGGSKPKSLDFRPSPQLLDAQSPSSFNRFNSKEEWQTNRQDKKLSSPFQAGDAKNPPRFESGFQPISYHQYASGYGTTATREQYTNSHTQYYNPWSSSQNIPVVSSTPRTTTAKPLAYRQDRKIINGAVSRSVVTTDASIEESKSSESSEVSGGTTTSSSELIEDWIRPHNKQINGQPNTQQRFPVYKKKAAVHDGRPLKIRPVKCERYHRYGFCPVTSHYPLAQVEKIASRCSALLAHLIAPLPKTDVHYDIVVTRNESLRGRAAGSSKRGGSRGWSWKSFKGKPLCNTEELKILPAYAKDEDGQWLIILQTQIWKQEAQVSICSLAHGAQSSCRGLLCNKDMRLSLKTKCVQRFTAQRLAVLDPENQDRCPIVKSVFLPSACVCLSDEGSSAEASSASREGSSSNQIQVIVPPSPAANGTFMIVTKKFTTNESSTESQVDVQL